MCDSTIIRLTGLQILYTWRELMIPPPLPLLFSFNIIRWGREYIYFMSW